MSEDQNKNISTRAYILEVWCAGKMVERFSLTRTAHQKQESSLTRADDSGKVWSGDIGGTGKQGK